MVLVIRDIARNPSCHLKAKIFISEDLKIPKEYSRPSNNPMDLEMLKNY
jgi:hypothetical protein